MFVVFFICGFACTCDDNLDDHDDSGSGSTRSFDELPAPIQVGVLDFGRISHMSLKTELKISQINININPYAKPTQFSCKTSS